MNDGYKNCPIYIRPHWDEFKAKVKSYMTPSADDSKYLYRVVCGSFANKANAEKLLNEVKSAYPDAFISAVVKK
jgi:cell division protein FtsN